MGKSDKNWLIRDNFWAKGGLEVFGDSETGIPVLVRHQTSFASFENDNGSRSSDNLPYVEIVLHNKLRNMEMMYRKVEVNLACPRGGRLNVNARNYWKMELLNFEPGNKDVLLTAAKEIVPEAAAKLHGIVNFVMQKRKENPKSDDLTIDISANWGMSNAGGAA